MKEIDFTLLPAAIKADAKTLERAARHTLNDVGFIAQKELTGYANSKMNFYRNPKQALSFRVKKATRDNLTVEITSDRKWMKYNLESGTRTPTGGLRHNGRSWLLVPVDESAFNRRGKMKSGYKKNAFILTKGDKGVIVYRRKRGDKSAKVIAILTPRMKYSKKFDPEDFIKSVMEREGTKILKKEIDKWSKKK